jgi:hypothetical protein
MKTKICRQKGAALIVTLVLLTVALLLGISSFQSSRMDEGMAGNYRASSSAFMAAEYGGSMLWEDFVTSEDRSSLCDGIIPADFTPIASDQLNLKYRYACSPEFEDETEKNEKFGRYKLVSTGRVDQEVPVDRHILYAARLGIGPPCAACISDEVDNCKSEIILPSSNAEFEGDEDVDGNFSAAIQVACTDLAEKMASSVLKVDQKYHYDKPTETYTCPDATSTSNKLCNYKGGIQGKINLEILKNPNLMAEFVRTLRGDSSVVQIINELPASADFSTGGSVYFLEPGADHTLDARGRANFVDGGNFGGKGILVIDGNVEFQGIPDFDGLILVLGDYIVKGGGAGAQADFNGSVVAAPVDFSDNADTTTETSGGNEYESCTDGTKTCHTFGPKTLEIGGGGDSGYLFNNSALLDSFGLIDHIDSEDGTGKIIDLWAYDGQNLGDRYFISEWQEIFK